MSLAACFGDHETKAVGRRLLGNVLSLSVLANRDLKSPLR